jgi:transcriptional regulator with XRE-family HTH domain
MMQKNPSKNYATEHISTALKAAREAKGMSQRALSKLAGVPQAHISKIEGNAVDLRLSSLLALAHALNFEVSLVPRKAVPAVQSLTRTAGTSFASPQISKDLARAGQAAVRLQEAFKSPELDRLRATLADITRHQAAFADTAAAHAIRKAIEAIHSGDDTKALRDALKRVTEVRNAIVHNLPMTDDTPRPAYQLEDDDV